MSCFDSLENKTLDIPKNDTSADILIRRQIRLSEKKQKMALLASDIIEQPQEAVSVNTVFISLENWSSFVNFWKRQIQICSWQFVSWLWWLCSRCLKISFLDTGSVLPLKKRKPSWWVKTVCYSTFISLEVVHVFG